MKLRKLVCVSLLFMGHVIQLQAQATTPDFGYADAGLIAVNHFAKLSNSNAELSLANSNSFGASVTNLGDLDGAGAGVTTIAVGTRNDNTGGFFRGAVYLVNINASGTIEGAPVKIAHGSSGISLRNGDGFGASVANLGDLDIGLSGTNATNSLVTIAVGVPGADIGSSAFTDEGAIYLINLNSSGIVGTPVKVTSNTTGITISNSANFGRSIANLGDLDGSGNGVVTLVAGLTGLEEGQQVSIINLNSAGAVVGNQLKYNQGYLGISLHNQDNFGTSIESLGDLDIGLSGTDATNSVLTIAIGAPEEVLTAVTGPESITPYPNNGGSIYLLNLDASGSKVGDVIKIGKDTPGLNANHAEGFGASILNLSDLDGTGDGVVTLAVASLGIGAIKIINLDETGAIVGPVGTIRDGNISETISMFDGFGQSMVNIGDINGDGIDEIAVGTSNFDAGKGSVNIISFASKAYGLTTSDAVNIFLPIAETGEPAPAYALSPTSLPTGLTFNETARTITGTPTQDTAGKDYTLTATNSSGTDTFSFRLGVGNLAPALSSDNDLSDLALSSHTSGGLAAIGTNYHPAIITALTLQPAFSSSTTAYTISETLAVGVQAAIIFPTTSSSRATITVDGKDAASGIGSPQVILNGGDNIISVVVTAEDGTSKEYTITAAKTRPPLEINEISDGYINNAEDESDITISGTSTGIADTETITVTFSDSNITTKTATVTNNAWETTIPSAEIKAAAEGTITVTATHTGTSTTATQTFKYDITPPTLASPIPDQEATVGRDFFLLFRGHSIFTNASEFVSTGESNGIIFTGPAWSGTGSSLVPGIVTITITAFDAAGNSVSDEFTITILTSSAPTIDSFSLTAGNAYIKTETLTFTNQENDESLTAVWFPSGENNCNETSYNAQVTSQVSGVKPTGNGIPITLSGTIADNSAGRTGDITYFVRAADSASDWNNRYVCAAVTDGRIVVTQRSDNRFELSKNRRPVVAFDPSAADTSDKQTFDLTINVTDSNADQTVTAKYKVIDSSDTCDATTTDTGATDITTAIGSTNGKTVTLTFNSEDDNGKKVCVNAEDHSGIPRDAAFSDTPGGIASFARPRASPTITGIDTTAPVLAATIDDQTATVGTDFTFTIPANTFTDSGTLTYTSSALTNGITFATDTWSGVGSGLTAGTVTITVTATDAAGNTATDEFDIVISGNNDPTDIALTSTTVPENTTAVGTFSTTDADVSDSHTYTLATGTGDEDNGKFTLDSATGVIAFTTAPDHENPTDAGDTAGDNTYAIRVQTDDGNGGTFEKEFIITVTDVDEAVLGGVSTSPALWVKANEGITENSSNVITGWTDQSPSAVAGTPAGSPVLSSSFINFNPTVLFDGTNDYFEFNRPSPISGRKSFTFIAVAGQNDISSDRFQFVLGANRGDRIGILFRNGNIARHRQIAGVVVVEHLLDPDPPVASGDIGIVGIRKVNGDTADDFTSYQDGAEFTKSAVNSSYTPVNTTSTFIGRESSSYRLNGQIAELVVFEDALSEADLDKVQTHLAIKYGITLDDDVANYVNSGGTSVFANSGTYVNDIVGIAKDDTSILDQRISKSKNTGVILTISTDATFTGVNSGHTGSLTDGQYLIIGNDGGATTTQTTETPARTTSRITREWKVENTGSVGEVNLKFDGFDNAYTLYTDDDGDFSTGATLAGALNANGEIATTFSNGVSYFTLTTAPTNSTPTDITLTLTNAAVNENQTAVGAFSTTDADVSDSHTYTLATGNGNEDNGKFTLDSATGVIAFTTAPDHENPTDAGDTAGDNTYAIRVQTDDGSGGTFEKEFIITVTDVAETDAFLSNLVVGGATISPAFEQTTEEYTVLVDAATTSISITPTVSHPDATIMIGLASAASGSTTPILLLPGLSVIDIFVTAEDGTTQKVYMIRITKGQTATISINTISGNGFVNAVDDNSDITISGESANIAEGETINVRFPGISTITDLSALVLANGTWSTAIPTAEMTATTEGTIEVTASYTGATDGNESFTYDRTAPTLAAAITDRTATVGTDFSFRIPTGTFTDANTLTYTSSGEGNGISFSSRTWSGVGANLTAGTLTITVTAEDVAGNTATDEFDIVISGNNDPTDIALTSTTVPENTTAVGTFSTTDADVSDSHTYTLATGTGDEDNGKFTLDSATGVIAFTTAPDHENPTDVGDTAGDNTYAIRVQTDDGNGGTFEKEFIITVTDVDEAVLGGVSTSPALWVKANEGITENSSNVITGWTDQSPSAVAGSPAGNPVLSSSFINFNPTVLFDGTNDRFEFNRPSPITGRNNFTFIAVAGQNDLSTALFQHVLGTNRANGVGILFRSGNITLDRSSTGHIIRNPDPPVALGDIGIVGISRSGSNGNNFASYQDGAEHTTSSARADYTFEANTTSTFIGSGLRGNGKLNGQVAELVVFEDVLSEADLDKVQTHLAIKYGITLHSNVANYVNAAGTSVFANSGTYVSDIVGIAKDDTSVLDQRISKSKNGGVILTISTDATFTGVNSGHTGSLTDGQYLIIGNDGGATTTQTTETPGVTTSRITREWKVENTGSVGEVNLKFDGFDNTYTLYTDDDGDFSTGATLAGALNANGEIAATFSNGVSYFTLTTAPLTTWTGTTDSTWTTATNWTDGVPTATHNVLIPKTTNQPTAATAVTVNKVTINSGASLIANAAFNGNVTYNRNIDFVSGNSKGWYLMASPVAGETYDDTYVAANDIGQGSLNNRGIATYNTSANSWEYFQNGGSGTFVSGKGYSIKKQTSTGAVAFTGTLNTDDVGVVLETTATNRFNLLGNPYPSYLNSTTFLNSETAISEEKTLWVWNQEISMYEAKNLVEPLMIAPGQGFFVKANTGGGTFNFSKGNQHPATATDTFQKSAKTQVKLDITDGDNHKNYCKIYYSEETTSGFDVGYDGELFSGAPNPFAIYTHLVSDSEGEHYQIQSLPYSDIENMVIPVGVNAASGKEISISADVTNFPAGVHLYLEDKLKKSFTQLSKNGAKYTVTLSDNLEGIGRFFLRASSSDLDDFSTSLENISVYTSSKNNLRIVGIQDGNVKLKAYNILGVEIIDTSFKGNGKNDVAIPSLAAGIYIVHLEMETGKISKKLVVE